MSFRGFLVLALLVLSGCGQAVKTASYTLPPTPAGRLCVEECAESKMFCEKECRLEMRGCVHAMQSQAIQDYQNYVLEQMKRREPVDLRARDFERPEKCSNASCLAKCEEPYQTCFKGCGGTVEATTSCQAFCF